MPLPIIDMHLHAMTADARGQPPLAFGPPVREWPVHNPAEPYPEVFIRWLKEPRSERAVWSPMTDDELRDQTLEVLERRNIIGVLMGTPERAAAWRELAPHRLIPATGMAVGYCISFELRHRPRE